MGYLGLGGAVATADFERRAFTDATVPYDTLRALVTVLSYYDLFPVGLGLDLAGATLLARGLFTRPDEFARRFIASRNSFNRFSVRAAEDRADVAAVAVLFCGFLAQGIGYVLYIGGAQSKTHGGTARLLAIAFLIVGFLAGFLIPYLTRPRRVHRFLTAFAQYDSRGTKHELPLSEELLGYAVVMEEHVRHEDYPHVRGSGNELTGEARRYWRVPKVRTHSDDNAFYVAQAEAAARAAEGSGPVAD